MRSMRRVVQEAWPAEDCREQGEFGAAELHCSGDDCADAQLCCSPLRADPPDSMPLGGAAPPSPDGAESLLGTEPVGRLEQWAWDIVLQYLDDPGDVLVLSVQCSALHALCSRNGVWRRLYLSRWELPGGLRGGRQSQVDWKDEYVRAIHGHGRQPFNVYVVCHLDMATDDSAPVRLTAVVADVAHKVWQVDAKWPPRDEPGEPSRRFGGFIKPAALDQRKLPQGMRMRDIKEEGRAFEAVLADLHHQLGLMDLHNPWIGDDRIVLRKLEKASRNAPGATPRRSGEPSAPCGDSARAEAGVGAGAAGSCAPRAARTSEAQLQADNASDAQHSPPLVSQPRSASGDSRPCSSDSGAASAPPAPAPAPAPAARSAATAPAISQKAPWRKFCFVFVDDWCPRIINSLAMQTDVIYRYFFSWCNLKECWHRTYGWAPETLEDMLPELGRDGAERHQGRGRRGPRRDSGRLQQRGQSSRTIVSKMIQVMKQIVADDGRLECNHSAKLPRWALELLPAGERAGAAAPTRQPRRCTPSPSASPSPSGGDAPVATPAGGPDVSDPGQ